MFAHSAVRGRVQVAFTDRTGGVRAGDPVRAARDFRPVVREFAGEDLTDMALMRQVHGATVRIVDRATAAEAPPVADGLVTDVPDLTLVVRVADCVPVLVGDVDRGVIAALHAGRAGLVDGVVPRGIAVLHEAGAQDVVAWIGPHICGRCYEVPADLRAQVAAVVPEAWAETSWGTPAVDVGAGVRAQLAAAGAEVVDVARCTREHSDLDSYRRDGDRSGRMAGLIRLRGVGA